MTSTSWSTRIIEGGRLTIKPFLKWAGGKRWLLDRPEFRVPEYTGTYIEPFLGGGAVYFAHRPRRAIISDANPRLIETYCAIRADWRAVLDELSLHQARHNSDYYYDIRAEKYSSQASRAAQFLYLNRTCWNGLYRENLKGEFNVPIGTKSSVIFEDDDFGAVSAALQGAEILNSDFEEVIARAAEGDLIFVDPPYTVAHNLNGFIKYNQKIFSWDDQVRLCDSLIRAKGRGARIMITNASHSSIRDLYRDFGEPIEIERRSVISGTPKNRVQTSELLYVAW